MTFTLLQYLKRKKCDGYTLLPWSPGETSRLCAFFCFLIRIQSEIGNAALLQQSMHMEYVPGTRHCSQQGLYKSLSFPQGFLGESDSKESACNAGDPLSGWFLIRILYQLARALLQLYQLLKCGNTAVLVGYQVTLESTKCFPPTPPTALAAGKAPWGASSQQLPAGAATTSNCQTVGNAQCNLAF